jgi:hypothetical protein
MDLEALNYEIEKIFNAAQSEKGINSTEWLSSSKDILKLVNKVASLLIEDDPSGLFKWLISDPDVCLFTFYISNS